MVEPTDDRRGDARVDLSLPSTVVSIARCAEHGLHGERTACFVCGGPVEQVAMAPLPNGVTRWEARQILGWIDAARARNVELQQEMAARDERVLDLEADIARSTTVTAGMVETGARAIYEQQGYDVRIWDERPADSPWKRKYREQAQVALVAVLEGGGELGA